MNARERRHLRRMQAQVSVDITQTCDYPDDRPKVVLSIQSRSWIEVKNVLVTERKGAQLGRERGVMNDARWDRPVKRG
jgi:hypothetical protein